MLRSLLKLEASIALILAIHKVDTAFDGEFILKKIDRLPYSHLTNKVSRVTEN